MHLLNIPPPYLIVGLQRGFSRIKKKWYHEIHRHFKYQIIYTYTYAQDKNIEIQTVAYTYHICIGGPPQHNNEVCPFPY